MSEDNGFNEWVLRNKDALDLDAAEISVCQEAYNDALNSDYARSKVGLAYWERNRLVALLSRLYPSGRSVTAIEGWDDEWHNCIYIDTPRGQLSWHIHDDEMVQFSSLPEYTGKWDGHTTDEKYRRILLLLLDLDHSSRAGKKVDSDTSRPQPAIEGDVVERVARAIRLEYFRVDSESDNGEEGMTVDLAQNYAKAAIAAMQPAIEQAVAEERARCVDVLQERYKWHVKERNSHHKNHRDKMAYEHTAMGEEVNRCIMEIKAIEQGGGDASV